MTERKKIIGIIDKWANRAVITKINGASVYDQNNATELTNALISAGIGDVKETEHRAEKVERAFRNFLAEYFTAVNEQNSYNCGIPEMFGRYANVLPYEDIVTSRLNEYLDEAEREIKEEKGK